MNPTQSTGLPKIRNPYLNYFDAYDVAVLWARHIGADMAIEVNHFISTLTGRKEYSVKFLPKAENRYGWELRCEVVTRDSPRTDTSRKDTSS